MCKKNHPFTSVAVRHKKHTMHNAINAQNTGLTCVTGDEEVK